MRDFREVRVVRATTSEELRPLAEQWQQECNCDEFGMKPNIESFLAEIDRLINNENSDVLILLNKDNEIAGLMGLTTFKNPISDGFVANEHFLYIAPKYRGMPIVRLINSAMEWAKKKDCTHLLLNASRMASSTYGRACMLYGRLKFKEFEKSYIKEL